MLKRKKIVIIDTNVCDILFPVSKKELSITYGKKEIQKLKKELRRYQNTGILYVTKQIQREFENRFKDSHPKAVEEFNHVFSGKTLIDSSRDISKINDLCKKIMDSIRDNERVIRKMSNNKKHYKDLVDKSQKEYDRLFLEWKNNNLHEGFYHINKIHEHNKKEYEFVTNHDDYLVIEKYDRIILSTLIHHAKKYEICFVTLDFGIYLMRNMLKNNYSIIVKGLQPIKRIKYKSPIVRHYQN